jgi:hypothetical protein
MKRHAVVTEQALPDVARCDVNSRRKSAPFGHTGKQIIPCRKNIRPPVQRPQKSG